MAISTLLTVFFDDLFIFFVCVEARTCLIRILVVSVDIALVFSYQFNEKHFQSSLLCVSSCVSWFALLIKASHINHSNRMSVVAVAVGTLAPFGPTLLDKTIATYNKVITDIGISFVVNVAVPYFADTPVNLRFRRSAMDYDLVYFAHLGMMNQIDLVCNLCL